MELCKEIQRELESINELPVEITTVKANLEYEEPNFIVWIDVTVYWQISEKTETLQNSFDLECYTPEEMARYFYDSMKSMYENVYDPKKEEKKDEL
jgi:hypothetical protein